MTEEQGETLEEAHIEAEEAPVEAEVEVPVEEEGPKKVIQIQAPPPFDEEALEPFVDYFMQARGLSDRKQAAVKLARVLFNIGYNPQREIQNVRTYIDNLSSVMDGIPNTDETMPVKGSILARSALDTSGMLRRTHFGTDEDEMGEFKGMFRFAQKAKMTMRMLDNIFQGEGNMSGRESETVQTLKEKVERMEKRSEFEQQLAPLKTQMANITTQLAELAKKPPTPETSPELKELQKTVNGIVTGLEKKAEQDTFTTEMKGLRDDFKTFSDTLKDGRGSGGKGTTDVGDAFDQAISLMDKIGDMQKKYGGEGGDVDWRSVAISTAGEIGTEAIKAARDIMSGKGEGELGEESKVEAEGEEKTAKISQRIIDRKLLGYIQKRVASGAFELDTRQAAKDLGVTSDDILDSYRRLRASGLVTTPSSKKQKPGAGSGGEGERKVEEQWVEG